MHRMQLAMPKQVHTCMPCFQTSSAPPAGRGHLPVLQPAWKHPARAGAKGCLHIHVDPLACRSLPRLTFHTKGKAQGTMQRRAALAWTQRLDVACHKASMVAGMARHGMAWRDMAWSGKAWHGMARYGMAGMAWHGLVWHGMAWLAMARYDMAWHGMAGMAWYGMAWRA